MGTRRDEHQDDGVLPPVHVVEHIGDLLPGDLALVYLSALGPAPAEAPPVGVVDLVDDVDELQPGDAALVYRPGSTPALVAGTVDAVTTPTRKRPVHTVTLATPVTGDRVQLTVTGHVLPESADDSGVLVHAYRVNTARVRRRARLAGHPMPGPDAATPWAVTDAAIVFGSVGAVRPWGLTDPGRIISYRHPTADDGTYQFPINVPSANAFISGYRIS